MQQNPVRPLELPDMMVWNRLKPLRRAFLARLQDDGPLGLDAAAVAHLDAAGLQLLLSLARDASSRGRRVVLQNASTRVLFVLRLTGAENLLDGTGEDH